MSSIPRRGFSWGERYDARCGSEWNSTLCGRDRRRDTPLLYRMRTTPHRFASAFSAVTASDDVNVSGWSGYLRFRLSYADLAELFSRTRRLCRSVHQSDCPVLLRLARKAACSCRRVCQQWSIDDISIRIAGWSYVTVRLSDEVITGHRRLRQLTRDTAAATTFLTVERNGGHALVNRPNLDAAIPSAASSWSRWRLRTSAGGKMSNNGSNVTISISRPDASDARFPDAHAPSLSAALGTGSCALPRNGFRWRVVRLAIHRTCRLSACPRPGRTMDTRLWSQHSLLRHR